MKNLAVLVLLHCLFSFNVNSFSQWNLTGPDGGGASKLAANNNILFVDQLVSTDNGSSWKISGLPGFNTIAFSGTNIYACTNDGVYISSDLGANWLHINNGVMNTGIWSITSIGNNLFALHAKGVLLSTDNGTVWTKVGSDTLNITNLTSHGSNLFAGTWNGMIESSDNGENWIPKNNGLPDTAVFSIAATGSYLYALAGDSVYCSSNEGNNWNPASPNAFPVNSLTASGNSIYAVMDKAIEVSTDNGSTWNYVFQYTDPDYSFSLNAFDVSGTNIYISANESYHFYSGSWLKISSNAGVDWTQITLPNSNIKDILADDSYILACSSNQTLFRLDKTNPAWSGLDSYSQSMSIGELAGSGNNIYMTAAFVRVTGGLFNSTDNGTSWTKKSIASGAPMNAGAVAVSGAKIAVEAARLSSGPYGVYLSTDNGSTWTPPGLSNIFIYCIAFTVNNVFACSDNGVFRSSDDGINWIQVNSGLTDTSVNAINVKGNDIFIAAKNGVYLSTNNGDNWTLANNGLSNVLVNSITSNGFYIFAGTDNGVFLSTDNGANWLTAGLSGIPVKDLAVNQTDLYAATNGAGVCRRSLLDFGLPVELTSFSAKISNNNICLAWQTATEINNRGFNVERSVNKSDWTTLSFVKGHGTTTSVTAYSFVDNSVQRAGEYYYRLKQLDNNGTYKYLGIVEIDMRTPSVFSLDQNYPNPFNPNTVISYSLPSASDMKLIVYNALGQSVKTLESGYKTAGNYSVNFNASDLSSGIYFYKLEAGQFTQIKKMMLIK